MFDIILRGSSPSWCAKRHGIHSCVALRTTPQEPPCRQHEGRSRGRHLQNGRAGQATFLAPDQGASILL